MRLTDLDPHWVLISRWDTPDGTMNFTNGDQSKRYGGGVRFNCPVHWRLCGECKQPVPDAHRLVVMFENPIDGLPPEATAKYRWQRSGETFDTLTLTPSINAQGEYPGCWHGHIVNGEVR